MSTVTHPLPNIESTGVSAAKQTMQSARKALYESSNRVLLIALGVLSAAFIANVAFTIGIYRESLQRQPLVVGVDKETGSVMALRPESLSLTVNDSLLRHYLEEFVTMHYERLPIISRRDYNRSLFQMSTNLTGPGSGVKEEWKSITALDPALNGTSTAQEVQVEINNSTYTGTRDGCHPVDGAAPCVGTVYFTKKYYTSTHTLDHVKASIVQMSFFLLQRVSPDTFRMNPIGLMITDLHESEGQ